MAVKADIEPNSLKQHVKKETCLQIHMGKDITWYNGVKSTVEKGGCRKRCDGGRVTVIEWLVRFLKCVVSAGCGVD